MEKVLIGFKVQVSKGTWDFEGNSITDTWEVFFSLDEIPEDEDENEYISGWAYASGYGSPTIKEVYV